MNLTIIISIITGIFSFAAFRNQELAEKLSFKPYKIIHDKDYYRIFSHALVHADWMHLLINIMVFISFGDVVEQYFLIFFGTKSKVLFLLLYIGGVFFASIYGLYKYKDNYYYSAVGASGAVSAVLMTSVLFQPTANVYFFGIIPIPGILFAVFYLIYSYKMAQKSNDNIAHDAHFYGALYGFIFPLLFKPDLFIRFIKILTDFV